MAATTKPARGVSAKTPSAKAPVPRGTRNPRVVSIVRHPNRRFPRHWTPVAVARVARYAVQAGSTPVEVQTEVTKALVALQVGTELLNIAPIDSTSTQNADIQAAFASISNWIPPIGIAIDTASSIYTRIHNFVALVRPDLASQFDRALVLLQHEAQFASETEAARRFLSRMAVYIQTGGAEVKRQIAIINDALDNSPAAQGIRAFAGFVDSLSAQAVAIRDRLLRLIGR